MNLKRYSGTDWEKVGTSPFTISLKNSSNNNDTLYPFTDVYANTSGGAFSLYLPASAQPGDTIVIKDANTCFASFNLTILNNGSNINGVLDNFVCNTDGLIVSFNYMNTTVGWQATIESITPSLTVVPHEYLGNLVEKKVIATDCSSVTFTGLDSLVDGDYYLECSLIATSTLISHLLMLINGDATETGYYKTRFYAGTSYTPTKDVASNDASLGATDINNPWVISVKLRVVSGLAFISTHSCRSINATDTTLFQTCHTKFASSITQIMIRGRGNEVGIKAGSTFTLYKSNAYQNLVPYNPVDITSRTSDYMVKPGEVVYRDYTNATSVPLYVATEEGKYEVTILGNPTVSPSSSSWVYLQPNNVQPTDKIDCRNELVISVETNVVKWIDGAVMNYFRLIEGRLDWAKLDISTFSFGKTVKVEASGIKLSSIWEESHIFGLWNTSTPWTSLGTITFPFAQSGKIIIKRIL